MKSIKFSIILTFFCLIYSVNYALAEETVKPDPNKPLTVEEIVNKANLAAYYQGQDGKAKVNMTITDNQGRTRNRTFIILRRDKKDGGDQQYYVYFLEPADVRKMVFMVWKHPGKDDDRWLYMPALDLVKRIAATDKRTSFVGSHFLYEDVSGRSIEEDTHELIKTTDDFYLLKNTPKDKNLVEFSYYNVWIDKSTFLPTKAEYYDDQGKIYRKIEVQETKEIQGYPTITKQLAEDLNAKGKTILEFTDISYDINLKADIFSERYLRRPPREVLR